jgi:hypothetical protein
LYSIENYLRVILHSVLKAQIGSTWLDKSIGPDTKKRIEKIKKDHLRKGVHTLPGRHDVYYIYLSDLTKIMAAARHLIIKVIADVDSWIVKTESVRVPRNLVGHMNFPNLADRNRIDALHTDLSGLMSRLEKEPGLKIEVP